jgi:hypothetical protein
VVPVGPLLLIFKYTGGGSSQSYDNLSDIFVPRAAKSRQLFDWHCHQPDYQVRLLLWVFAVGISGRALFVGVAVT